MNTMNALTARIARLFTSSTFSNMTQTSPGAGAGVDGKVADAAPTQYATVAAGCFWGVEHIYRKFFEDKGLTDCRVGYVGGSVDNPTYRAVCSGSTGHAEAVRIVFDPTQVTYSDLIEFFYRIHDPCTPDRQGPDRGSQYRSAIFYHDADQERVARETTELVNKHWWDGKVVTAIVPAGRWWDAEEYHQLYLDRNKDGYQCPSHYKRDDFPSLDKFRKQ